MPPPVILVHAAIIVSLLYNTAYRKLNVLSKRSINTTLCSYSVRTSGKELRDTGSVEASLSETKGCSQTRTSSTNNNGIILVIDDRVLAGDKA